MIKSNISQSEDALQTECCTWFHNTHPQHRGLLFAVPNGGKRSVVEANRMKHMGLVAGIPDMIFAYAGKITFLEFKTLDGKLSDVQKEIHIKLMIAGFDIRIVRDFDTFRNIIHSLI